jgi:hypothetical protein
MYEYICTNIYIYIHIYAPGYYLFMGMVYDESNNESTIKDK